MYDIMNLTQINWIKFIMNFNEDKYYEQLYQEWETKEWEFENKIEEDIEEKIDNILENLR